MHIEVPDDMCARDIHALTRQISEGLAAKFGILATVASKLAKLTQRLLCMPTPTPSRKRTAILQVRGGFA